VLFGVASVLVVVATVQLFLLPTRTERFFAWKIDQPLTAVVDGAFYFAAVFLLVPVARASRWRQVRPVAWGVLVISSGKLAATLLHLDPFHLDHGETMARVAAWGWLVVYALVPVALVVLIAAQARVPGSDPPPVAPAPPQFRWFGGVVAGALVAVGLALIVIPGTATDRWPWPLTDLTAQDLGAWFAGIGVVGGLAVLEGDVASMRPVWVGSLTLAILQGVALVRYPGAVTWGGAAAWLYAALFASVGAAGVWGWRLSTSRPVSQ
jgi:hypothetical protein